VNYHYKIVPKKAHMVGNSLVVTIDPTLVKDLKIDEDEKDSDRDLKVPAI
jgi:hypothetical protein